MKKISILVFGVLFFACTKQTTIPLFNLELATVTFNEYNPCLESLAVDPLLVPLAIQEMLKGKYPSANLVQISEQNDNGTLIYDVRLDNDKEILLRGDATVLVENTASADEIIPTGNLSNKLHSFVAANFPGFVIEGAVKMNEFGNQYIKIQLSQEGQVLFNVAEEFICASGNINAYGYADDDDDGGDDDDG